MPEHRVYSHGQQRGRHVRDYDGFVNLQIVFMLVLAKICDNGEDVDLEISRKLNEIVETMVVEMKNRRHG